MNVKVLDKQKNVNTFKVLMMKNYLKERIESQRLIKIHKRIYSNQLYIRSKEIAINPVKSLLNLIKRENSKNLKHSHWQKDKYIKKAKMNQI